MKIHQKFLILTINPDFLEKQMIISKIKKIISSMAHLTMYSFPNFFIGQYSMYLIETVFHNDNDYHFKKNYMAYIKKCNSQLYK